MNPRHFPKGLDGRMRDRNGEIHHKRGDTLVGTLRETYGEGFAPGYDDATPLMQVLKDKEVSSLDRLLKSS